MKEKNNNNNHDSVTTVTFLNRQQIDYLDKLGKDSLFMYGHKLSRSKTLSELVSLLMNMGVDFKEIDLNNESLSEGILRLMRDEHKEPTT